MADQFQQRIDDEVARGRVNLNAARLPRNHSETYQVRPRTGGSPGCVDRDYAMRILGDGVQEREHARAGFYGPERKAVADRDDLTGVMVVFIEERCHWRKIDIATGQTYIHPYLDRTCKHALEGFRDRLERIASYLVAHSYTATVKTVYDRRLVLEVPAQHTDRQRFYHSAVRQIPEAQDVLDLATKIGERTRVTIEKAHTVEGFWVCLA